jgi:hypothetical protein
VKFVVAMIGALSLAVAVPAIAGALPTAHLQGNGSGTNGSGTNGSGTTGTCVDNGSGTNGSGTNGSGTSGSGTDCTQQPTDTAFNNNAGGGAIADTGAGGGGGNGSLAYTGESTVIPLAVAAVLVALALFVRHLARSRQPE